MTDITQLATRYSAIWNEKDGDARRRAIAALWVEGARRKTDNLEADGYDAIEERVTGAHEQFVGAGGLVFRLRNYSELGTRNSLLSRLHLPEQPEQRQIVPALQHRAGHERRRRHRPQ